MRNTKSKVKCTKISITKSDSVFKAYNDIQLAYVRKLEQDDSVKEIKSNIPIGELEGLDGKYATDFFVIRSNGDVFVRECVYTKYLTKPMTIKLLDASRVYWAKRGVEDWGIVVDGQEYFS